MALTWVDLHNGARQALREAEGRNVLGTLLARAVAARYRGEELPDGAAPAQGEIDRVAWLLAGRIRVIDPEGVPALEAALAEAELTGNVDGVLEVAEACEQADLARAKSFPRTERAAFFYEGALRFWEQGDLMNAAADAASSLAADPHDIHVRSNRGAWLYQLELPWAAVQEWEQAVAFHPSYSKGWMKMGTVLAELGHIERARTCFEAALENAPAEWPYRAAVEAELAALGSLRR
jgi:tetratricopeptide (TPR) repeat protein